MLSVITFPRNIMLFPGICPQSECLHLFHFIPSYRILSGVMRSIILKYIEAESSLQSVIGFAKTNLCKCKPLVHHCENRGLCGRGPWNNLIKATRVIMLENDKMYLDDAFVAFLPELA